MIFHSARHASRDGCREIRGIAVRQLPQAVNLAFQVGGRMQGLGKVGHDVARSVMGRRLSAA